MKTQMKVAFWLGEKQKMPFGNLKDRLLPSRRWPFDVQKTALWNRKNSVFRAISLLFQVINMSSLLNACS